MSIDQHMFLKSLTPKIASKAIQTFDRATTIVVCACWGAAILMMGFALYTVTLAVSSKHASDAALIAEPILPKIAHKNIDSHMGVTILERLQHSFPDINFSLTNTQAMKAETNDGGKFRQWLMALSYVDTVSPGVHWTMQEFCVGHCTNNQLMHALLVGEHVTFEAATDDKN